MALHSIGGASALPIALAVIPSLPRPYLARLVARMIDRLDELDGDADIEPDDEDMGAEDDPQGFDPESDFCSSHEDFGTHPLRSVDRGEVRRIKRAARDLRRRRAA